MYMLSVLKVVIDHQIAVIHFWVVTMQPAMEFSAVQTNKFASCRRVWMTQLRLLSNAEL